MIDITPIIETVIAVICAIITAFVIPYIKTKISKERFAFLEDVVKVAVYAAEVLIEGDGRGEEKRLYVLNHVKDVCEQNNITYDVNEVRQLIEKSWTNLMSETKER